MDNQPPEKLVNQTPTEAHTQPVVAPPPGDFYHDSDLLGAEITELCGFIYAATQSA